MSIADIRYCWSVMNRASVTPTRYAPGGSDTFHRTRKTCTPIGVTSTVSPVKPSSSATSACSSSSAMESRPESPVAGDHPEPVAVLQVENLVEHDQILAAAKSALGKAGLIGHVPTPLDVLTEAVGLNPIVDIGDLPPDIAARKPRAWKRILGALVFPARTAFVDLSQAEPRARLTHAHEIGHRILPWHEGAFHLDNHERLLGLTRERLEVEAYLAGGHLLFQPRFMEQALGYQFSIKTPIALAGEYAASMHATVRYYVMHMPEPVAVLIAGRYRPATSVPVWDSVESLSFHSQFGHLADRMSNARLEIAGGDRSAIWRYRLFRHAGHRGRFQGATSHRLAGRPPSLRGRSVLQPAQPLRDAHRAPGGSIRSPRAHANGLMIPSAAALTAYLLSSQQRRPIAMSEANPANVRCMVDDM